MYDSHVELAKLFSRCTVTEKGCWEWNGTRFPTGYACIGRNGYGHRISWETTHEPIAPGRSICHTCDNPPCINPSHLFIGTQGDNIRDAVRKGRLARGSINSQAKLTEPQIEKIRSLYAAGNTTHAAIAIQFGLSRQHVGDIVNRRRWGWFKA